MTQQINRRTVTKGIAWSVPVLAVAGASPAFASSGDGPLTLTGEACKLPGGSSTAYKHGYVYLMDLVNKPGPGPGDAYVVINSVKVNNIEQSHVGYKFVPKAGYPAGPPPLHPSCTQAPCSPPSSRIVLSAPDDTVREVFLYTDEAGSSPQTSLIVNYTVFDCSLECGEGANYTTTTAPVTPPIQEGGGGRCSLDSNVVFPLPEPIIYPAAGQSARMAESQEAEEELLLTDEAPAEDPPAEELSAEEPPTEEPPAEDPSAEEPPAEESPSEEPPAEDPPAEESPSEEPPLEEPETTP
ncbi:MAG: hypothetical protein Q4G35_07255 [Propionibacteriaceae bacterium]|nr:hypothetical protein [Propionibacteriaceae bacterium]